MTLGLFWILMFPWTLKKEGVKKTNKQTKELEGLILLFFCLLVIAVVYFLDGAM